MEVIWGILLTDVIFILIAFGVNESNAPYLLSGYNTLPKEKQAQYDLKNYLKFFKRFFIVMSVYTTLAYVVMYLIFGLLTAVYGYVILLLGFIIYFVIKGFSFKKHQSD